MTYCDKIKSVTKLYIVAKRPLDLDKFENNESIWDDYGYGIYLFPNPSDAILSAAMQNLGDPMETQYGLYEYHFNGLNLDMFGIKTEHWMYKLYESVNNPNPSVKLYDRDNWNCYAGMIQNYIIAHKKSGDLTPCVDCALTAGPIIDLYLWNYLQGPIDINDSPLNIERKIMEHFKNIKELPSCVRIEYCFKNQMALKRLSFGQCIRTFSSKIEFNQIVDAERRRLVAYPSQP